MPLVASADANYVDLMSPVHVARANGGTSSSPSVGGLYLPSYAKYKVFTGTDGTCDFGIYKGTSSSNTILFGAGMYNENAPSNAVIINAPLSLGATDDYTGSYGQVLMSNGSSSKPSWVTIHEMGAIGKLTLATAYSSAGGAYSGSYTWTSTTATSYSYVFIKDTTSSSSTAGTYIYFCEFTGAMSTADRWFRIQKPSTTGTYYGLVATPRKNTTAGYAPGLISIIGTGSYNSYLYIAIDENTSANGMNIMFCRRVS